MRVVSAPSAGCINAWGYALRPAEDAHSRAVSGMAAISDASGLEAGMTRRPRIAVSAAAVGIHAIGSVSGAAQPLAQADGQAFGQAASRYAVQLIKDGQQIFHYDASVPLIPKFARERVASCANFGIGTLAGFKWANREFTHTSDLRPEAHGGMPLC